MKKTETLLRCDGCEGEIPVNDEGNATEGVSLKVNDPKDTENVRSIDLCAECGSKLPEGTKRKKPGRKKGK